MLIDKKGRIFGKVNIIDFLVLLFILCLTPAFYVGYKIMTKPTSTPTPTTITLDKAEYEKDKARLSKLDLWLKENKRLRKYFE